MAKVVDETIKRYWHKKMISFFKYYPMRIKNVGEVNERTRELIFSFKDGVRFEEVAQLAAKHLKEEFGDKVTEIVYCCIPASSAEKNEKRYKKFCERVCELSGAINGYDHVKVSGERLAVHEHRRDKEKDLTKVQIIEFDEPWWQNKAVVLQDDLLTTGTSWARFGSKLEEYGAEILMGLFIGKTTYKLETND